MLNENDCLVHYGVLGMKWGVRKNPDRAYAKSSEKVSRLVSKSKKKYAKSENLRRKAYNRRATPGLTGNLPRNRLRKARRLYRSSVKYAERANRFMNSMKRIFENTSYKNAMDNDFSEGSSYVNDLISESRRKE